MHKRHLGIASKVSAQYMNTCGDKKDLHLRVFGTTDTSRTFCKALFIEASPLLRSILMSDMGHFTIMWLIRIVKTCCGNLPGYGKAGPLDLCQEVKDDQVDSSHLVSIVQSYHRTKVCFGRGIAIMRQSTLMQRTAVKCRTSITVNLDATLASSLFNESSCQDR